MFRLQTFSLLLCMQLSWFPLLAQIYVLPFIIPTNTIYIYIDIDIDIDIRIKNINRADRFSMLAVSIISSYRMIVWTIHSRNVMLTTPPRLRAWACHSACSKLITNISWPWHQTEGPGESRGQFFFSFWGLIWGSYFNSNRSEHQKEKMLLLRQISFHVVHVVKSKCS